jgi:hypothetical protein
MANSVHGGLDLEPDFDDLLHGGHRIGHRSCRRTRDKNASATCKNVAD